MSFVTLLHGCNNCVFYLCMYMFYMYLYTYLLDAAKMWRDDRNKFAEVAQEHVRLSIEMPEKDYFPIPTAWKAGGILNIIFTKHHHTTFDTMINTEKNIKVENLIYDLIYNSIFHYLDI